MVDQEVTREAIDMRLEMLTKNLKQEAKDEVMQNGVDLKKLLHLNKD